MKRITIAIFLLLAVNYNVLTAQEYTTQSVRAVRYYEKAVKKLREGDLQTANKLTEKALEKDSLFVEAIILKAELKSYEGNPDEQLRLLEKVININPDFDRTLYYIIANIYFDKQKYRKALENYNESLKAERVDGKIRIDIYRKQQLCKFRIYQLSHPVRFEPKNLGSQINTPNNDYFPSITADGNTIFFTTELKTDRRSNVRGKYQEDIYFSIKKNGKWQKSQSIGASINTFDNEGAPAISADGKTLLFTYCTCPDGMIRCCDIYVSFKTKQGWSQPRKLPYPINTRYWESQPCMSADGRTIYFVSNRPGGLGKKDIWYCTLNDDNKWSKPVNLSEINTPGNETCPFIHTDNKTLYFASDYLTGMGGFDIFMSKKNADGKFSAPENLGYPINTHENEEKLIVAFDGKTAYFSSDRNQKNNKDLYSFVLPKQYTSEPTIYLSGKTYDKYSKNPLWASIKITDIITAKQTFNGVSNKTDGSFLAVIPDSGIFAIYAYTEDYLPYSININLKELPDSNSFKYIDVPLVPIRKGEKFVLRNVFFDTDSFTLKPESYIELDRVADFLRQHPNIKIEVGGHTDNVGSPQYNLKLSERRSKSVAIYLIKNGKIPENRIKYKGYGMSVPIASNDTKQGRQLNRRTEIKIISIN